MNAECVVVSHFVLLGVELMCLHAGQGMGSIVTSMLITTKKRYIATTLKIFSKSIGLNLIGILSVFLQSLYSHYAVIRFLLVGYDDSLPDWTVASITHNQAADQLYINQTRFTVHLKL